MQENIIILLINSIFGKLTPCFKFSIYVRQRDVLSPNIFKIFILKFLSRLNRVILTIK